MRFFTPSLWENSSNISTAINWERRLIFLFIFYGPTNKSLGGWGYNPFLVVQGLTPPPSPSGSTTNNHLFFVCLSKKKIQPIPCASRANNAFFHAPL